MGGVAQSSAHTGGKEEPPQGIPVRIGRPMMILAARSGSWRRCNASITCKVTLSESRSPEGDQDVLRSIQAPALDTLEFQEFPAQKT